jgi:hypothetical protein
VESLGFIGLEAVNAMVLDDVFFPIHPLSSLKDKKEPLLICRVNETKFEALGGLLVICSVVLSAVFVVVTVTLSDEAFAREYTKLESKIPMVNAKRIFFLNNTFLNNRNSYL